MKKIEFDILLYLYDRAFENQRKLAERIGHSLGLVNKSINNLIRTGYLQSEMILTEKAIKAFQDNSPKNAVILAAGFGMRMVPINTQIPKALLEVHGELLIERAIKQLIQKGITEIYVVVGFMKEKFEYLIDKYGVELIVNNLYGEKNNLYSLYLARKYLSNTYIVPCDIWAEVNPFSSIELYPWYMVTDIVDDESDVRVNRKMELVHINKEQGGNSMIGISYLTDDISKFVREKLEIFCKEKKYDHFFWEETLFDGDRMILNARVVHASQYVEINTYEQLRELDEESSHLKTDAIHIISKVLSVNKNEIVDIDILKKGMTNRSFLFSCKDNRYVMRIPGEGTEHLINRKEEAEVYKVLRGKGISDEVIYINPDNGYKITKYVPNSRVCDTSCYADLVKCMGALKKFHSLKLVVNHDFDIFKHIDFYEKLWDGETSIYSDYLKTKMDVLSLKEYVDKYVVNKCLTHIDAVPDNFLFDENNDVRMIDWEYAGMQDPHVDIAMFCIYALYNKQQIDRLIDIYFEGHCPKNIRIKIYAYISICGLLWSNWCEYKRNLGVEFGEYSLRQYRYAKEYYRIVKSELERR